MPASLVPHILSNIRSFEIANPNLVVTSFSVEKYQEENHPQRNVVYGIWVSHLPKEQCFPNYKPPPPPS